MGHRRSINDESIYFQRLNRQIFSSAGANWNQITPIIKAMHSIGFVDRQAQTMKKALVNGNKITEYFGPNLAARLPKPHLHLGLEGSPNNHYFPYLDTSFP